MDRIRFRKRTASTAQKDAQSNGHNTLKKTPSHQSFGDRPIGAHKNTDSSFSNGRSRAQELLGKSGNGLKSPVGDKPPSLDVDIRNSLILPGLSQRFSVLLPSLFTAPESSIRDLLASQRNREGPSLTQEEEELLFQEIHQKPDPSSSRFKEWDGRPPALSPSWLYSDSTPQTNGNHESTLPTSTSSPSVLVSDSVQSPEQRSAPLPLPTSRSADWATSPPPTSNSFASFQTFGIVGKKEKSPKTSPISPNSYHIGRSGSGFSSGSTLRDEQVMRQKAKNRAMVEQEHTASISTSSSTSGQSDEAAQSLRPQAQVTSPEKVAPPSISIEKANDYYRSQQNGQHPSPSASEESATPTSTVVPGLSPFTAKNGLNSSSTSLTRIPPDNMPVQPPPPTTDLPPTPGQSSQAQLETSTEGKPKKKRASLLAGLTPAQVKRISSALGEIEQKLQRTSPLPGYASAGQDEDDAVEELDPVSPVKSAVQEPRQRLPSDARSDVSSHSNASSVFPFGTSPTGSSFTANMSTAGSTTTSPPKISHSPRSHDLQAVIAPSTGDRAPSPPQPTFKRAEEPAAVPRPILTPSRTRPARHTPSHSISSNGQATPVPVYVPGQPRPVGSMHRSDGSVSSRSGTPTQVLDHTTNSPSALTNLAPGHSRSDSTPSPRNLMIHPRSASLGRSRSVNQVSAAPSAYHTPVKSSSLHESGGSISSTRSRGGQGGQGLGEPSSGRRLSSSLGSHSPRADDIIEEDDEEEYDSDGRDRVRPPVFRADSDRLRSRGPGPLELKSVPGRRSVADSKHSSLDHPPVESPGKSGTYHLSPAIASCTPSQEGTLDESSETHGDSTETHNTSLPVSRSQSANGSIIATGQTLARVRSPTLTLRRSRSLDSLSSGFMDIDELGWEDIFRSSSDDSEVEVPTTPGDDLNVHAQTLRRLTGVGQSDMAVMQDKLVEKAKQERRALRAELDESPMIPYSPSAPAGDMPINPQLIRSQSPRDEERQATTLPYTRNALSPIGSTHEGAIGANQSLGSVESLATTAKAPSVEHNGVLVVPRRAAPPPPPGASTDSLSAGRHPQPSGAAPPSASSHQSPSEESEEVVFTPFTPGLTRKVSRRVAPEDDPEIRRDFEARIAAATAALNRTPSNTTGPSHGGGMGSTSGSISRKFSRNKGAVNISSPRLMSSTSNVTTTPLSTPDTALALDANAARALEKASGSSGKMSLGWKKLKKGLSFSGDPNNSSPFSNQSQSPSEGKILEEPIALRRYEEHSVAAGDERSKKAPKPVTLTSPDINAFKFPNSATSASSEITRPRPDIPLPSPPATAPIPSLEATSEASSRQGKASKSGKSRVSKPITADSPPERFVKAGRAAGLDDDQLEEMMLMNNLGRSPSSGADDAGAVQRSFSKSEAEPGRKDEEAAVLRSLPVRKDSIGKAKGLLRSFSRNKKAGTQIDTDPLPTSNGVEGDDFLPTPTVLKANPPGNNERKVVVRRTLLIPSDAPSGLDAIAQHVLQGGPGSPRQGSTGAGTGSPGSAQRKGSIKRKPLNLSREDQQLVIDTPSPHSRKFSVSSSVKSNESGDIPGQQSSTATSNKPNLGLGFLQPPGTADMSRSGSHGSAVSATSGVSGTGRSNRVSAARSSAGGSFLEYYSNEDGDAEGEGEETLLSPGRASHDGPRRRSGRASTQAVEITEYADGQLVWSLVDGLREVDAVNAEQPNDQSHRFGHSRDTSYASTQSGISEGLGESSKTGKLGGTMGLNLRHKDRGVTATARPPTNVYYTSHSDIADLMDHLSKDLESSSRGRIDILPFTRESEEADLGASKNKTNDNNVNNTLSMVSGQFEDAPSPRKGPPAPIHVPKYQHHTASTASPEIAASPRSPTSRHVRQTSTGQYVGSAFVPAGGFSPKRQMFLRQGQTHTHGHGQRGGSVSTNNSAHRRMGSTGSPSAASFATRTSISGMSGVSGMSASRSVEDRLQALLDRLKDGGMKQREVVGQGEEASFNVYA